MGDDETNFQENVRVVRLNKNLIDNSQTVTSSKMPIIQTITPKEQSLLPGLAGVPFPKHIRHYDKYG